VPAAVVGILLIGMALQFIWHGIRPAPLAAARALPPAMEREVARVLAFGDDVVLARALMLWLQAFDNQPGVSIPFAELDFDRVEQWLKLITQIDPSAQYPYLAAARVYGSVTEPDRQRQMFEFVYRAFLAAPGERWRWLAHASLVAKHQLKDLELALRYARALTEHAQSNNFPAWARDMSVILLQEMGEVEAAKALIGALLENDQITDLHELRFLVGRLRELAQGQP